MPLRPLLIAAAVNLLGASLSGATPDPLAQYRWSARIIVASAPDDSDPALARQRAIFAQMGAEARARDLVLVEAVGDGADARAIRTALQIGEQGFTAVLVGKDGGAKLRAGHPLSAAALLPLIDAMPMRQQERRDRGT